MHRLRTQELHVDRAAQQPHAAIGELNKVHAPHCPGNVSISDYAPQVRRAVADTGRWATLARAPSDAMFLSVPW
jgi:hypothetical protein